MTINWERESGDRIEEYLAAQILLDAGRGNQIRPSQGDNGIDVQVPNDDGWDIYQIKRFASNLSSSSRAQIRSSWVRFKEEVLPNRRVRSWSLVLPLEPTPQNEKWFETLTKGVDFEVRWIGRAIVDGWAASNPKLVDYFFGDGGRRLQELMTLAFSGGASISRTGDNDFITSIKDRYRSLSEALEEVDPFYRYELEVRSGSIEALPPLSALEEHARPGLVMSTLEQIDASHYLVTHVFARSAASVVLRPIENSFQFSAEDPEQRKALERWFHYGAPLNKALGTVVRSEGPPGTTTAAGTSATAWTLSPIMDDALPPLEARVRNKEGQVIARSAVTASTLSAAVQGDGRWLLVHLGPAAHLQYFVGSTFMSDHVTISTDLGAGATPAEVLSTLDLIAKLPDNDLELAVREGPLFMPTHRFSENEMSEAAAEYYILVSALATIQKHTFSRITLPDLASTPAKELQDIIRVATLLEGRTIYGRFRTMVLKESQLPEAGQVKGQEFMIVSPLQVQLGGVLVDTDMNERRKFESVNIDRSAAQPTLIPGTSDRVIAEAISRVAKPVED